MDVNGDGKLDSITSEAGANVVNVRLGNGHGGLFAGTDLAVGQSPQWVVAGDFNGDGKVDIATANAGDNTVSVLLGNGSGSFGPLLWEVLHSAIMR